MKRFNRFVLTTICLLALSGCVSREQADAKLARGCEAGVKALLPEGMTLDRVTEKKFSPSPEGRDMRHVTLKTVTLDGWLETEQDYECIFEESFGLFNMSYTAAIHQVHTGDKVYGRAGREILGDAEDFLKLEEAIRGVMYED